MCPQKVMACNLTYSKQMSTLWQKATTDTALHYFCYCI